MLHAPEAARGYSALLSSFWDLSLCFGVEGEASGGCEGAEEALNECWHLRRHDQDSDENEEADGCERQLDCRLERCRLRDEMLVVRVRYLMLFACLFPEPIDVRHEHEDDKSGGGESKSDSTSCMMTYHARMLHQSLLDMEY